MIKAVFFDLDGTLLNTLLDLTISVNYALKENNLQTVTIEKVRQSIGNGVDKLIERVVDIQSTDTNIINNVKLKFIEYYKLHNEDNTIVYDKIMETLELFHDKGLKNVIISNKFDYAVKQLSKNLFGNIIDLAIGEGSDVRIKPFSDGCNKAMRLLNLSKENIIYVGDSDVDILTAHNFGVKCISVTWGYQDKNKLLSANADYIVDNTKQLIEIVFKN
ncbi:MAG: HAD family hydrolase [Clostridia bacterium]